MLGDKVKLYAGLVRDGKWYNHTIVHPLTGGIMIMLDSGDKSGAARLLNLIKGAVSSLYTEEGEEYKLQPKDYLDIKAVDTWKIGYEEIKIVTGEQYPIINENFYCNRCSRTKHEQYTEVKESWQELIDKGLVNEVYLNNKDEMFYEAELAEPITIESGRTVMGGTFDSLIMQPISIGDMIKIQKDPNAMATEANLVYATWDASIVKIPGISEKDFNIIKRTPDTFFTKKYITTQKNYDAMLEAENKNMLGVDASGRSIMCANCGAEIGGYLDFTNFFTPLLPRKSPRK